MTLKVHRIGKKDNKMVDFLETVYDVCFSWDIFSLTFLKIKK